jgi:hypothetical protein
MIKGFHYKDGLYFIRNKDNSVSIVKINDGDESQPTFTTTIDEHGWASIISSVSAMGEDYGRYYDALKWHNGIDYQRICDYYGITLHKVVRGDNYCKNNGEESYINSSYYAGGSKPDIFIGIYDDMELEKISFFHELGHYFEKLDRNMCNSYDIEAEAWRIGLEKAKEFNVSFTDNAIKWANDQLETYRVEDKQYKIQFLYSKSRCWLALYRIVEW